MWDRLILLHKLARFSDVSHKQSSLSAAFVSRRGSYQTPSGAMSEHGLQIEFEDEDDVLEMDVMSDGSHRCVST